MDLSMVFDCLPHDLMLTKLATYGMATEAGKLLNSYLRHRKQRVKISEDNSEWMTLLKGVPQGSILGPCLFNLFLIDPSLKQTNVVNYADVNALYSIADTLQRVTQKKYDAD